MTKHKNNFEKTMDITIRKTNKEEYFRTEYLTRETFWNLYVQGAEEHLVLHNLRKSKSYISELDLVAVVGNEIVGHIISTKAKVIDEENNEHEILCVGPLFAVSSLQKKGIGSKLLQHSFEEARRLGYPGMILFGYPSYYHRFGFVNAKEYGITTKDLQNFEPFMALELTENSLSKVKGRFFEDEAFFNGPKELEEFEKQFPYKVKKKTDTQLNHK